MEEAARLPMLATIEAGVGPELLELSRAQKTTVARNHWAVLALHSRPTLAIHPLQLPLSALPSDA